MDDHHDHPSFSIVTGASSGIGLELARVAATHGSDLLIVADGEAIHSAAEDLRRLGVAVDALQVDLSTREGVAAVHERAQRAGRPVDALFANAGTGLGDAFLDQEPDAIQRVIDTNISGTVHLLHRFGTDMRQRGRGRILITGSIAGLIPGTFLAVYNASKAFIDSFAYALRHELEPHGVVVTCLMPGATETEFFEKADLEGTRLAEADKQDAAEVARLGYEALLRGDGHEVTGLTNKLQAMMARVLGPDQLAKLHREMAEPGSARKAN